MKYLRRLFHYCFDRRPVLTMIVLTILVIMGLPFFFVQFLYELWKEQHIPDDVAYKMTLAYQWEIEQRAHRIINNTDFAEYMMDAMQENMALTEREAVLMYLDDTPLASDFLTSGEEER